MLQRMRRGAQTVTAKIVAVIICFVLVVFGFGAFNVFVADEPAAATVNGEDITQRRLASVVQLQRRSIAAQLGEDATDAQIDMYVDSASILDSLVNREIVEQAAASMKLTGSRQEFLEFVRNQEVFQEDGEFSQEQFLRAISQQGYSPQTFERAVSVDNQVSQMVSVLKHTSIVTPEEREQSASILFQTRDLAYMQFKPDQYRESIELDDDQVLAYYDLHAEKFMSDEEFSFDYIEHKSDVYLEQVTVNDEEVASIYEAEVEDANFNARRRSRHILLDVDENRTLEDAIAELQDVWARVEAGESFEHIAKDISTDPGSAKNGGDLGFATRDAWVPAFRDALWALSSPGEVSQPVETTYGVHLIQLLEIEAVEHPSFDERREALVEERKKQLALQRFEEDIVRLDGIVFEQSDSLEPAAEAFRLEIKRQDSVTRLSGQAPFNNPTVRAGAIEPDVIDNAFNSRPIVVEPGYVVVARLVDRLPPEKRPFDQVEADIRERLINQEAESVALTSATQAYGRLNERSDFSSISNEYGIEWIREETVRVTNTQVPSSIVEATFRAIAPVNEERTIVMADMVDGSQAVVVVSHVRLGDYGSTTDSERKSFDATLRRTASSREYNGVLKTLKGESTIEILSSDVLY